MTWTILSNEERAMRNNCVAGFPLESCGLFLGPVDGTGKPKGEITKIWPANNIAQSARIYEVDPKDMFKATQYCQENGLEIVGVYHSHTHSEAFPSPTDVKQAVDLNWCYSILSLNTPNVDVRYFSIYDSQIEEIKCEVV